VGVRVDTDDLERLAAGETVETELCTPDGTRLDLDPGAHRFRTAPGATTGIHVDRLVLRSGEARVAEPVAEPTVERTRSTRTVTVAPCPTGCWLVLGEGYNPAWEARISDTTVTPPVAPVQVAGGFNGWWLSPSETARTVELRWTPQRGLDLALGIALLGVVACVILALVDRRVRPTALPVAPPDDGIEPATDRPRQAFAAAAVLVVAAGLAIAPVWALVALVPAAVIVATRRSSSAALAASVTVGVLGLMVAWRQYRERFFPDAAWPGRFDDLHRPGVFVVVLLLAGTWIDRTAATRPRDADGPDDRTGVDALDDVDGSGPDQDTAAVTTDPAR
jgi:arabinofuranan 3-O-arabinosyltransferase